MECVLGLEPHAYLMLQVASQRVVTLAGSGFEGLRPNGRPNDMCGEGLCRKRLQQSIDRSMSSKTRLELAEPSLAGHTPFQSLLGRRGGFQISAAVFRKFMSVSTGHLAQ